MQNKAWCIAFNLVKLTTCHLITGVLTVKKLLIPVAAASIGAAAYLYQQHESAYDVLNYIPADTVLFAGSLQPEPIEEYLAMAAQYANNNDLKKIESLLSDQEATSPAVKFLTGLFEEYQSGLVDPKKMIATFGLGESVKSYLYTLGLVPVAKIQIDNPQAMWTLLDKHEADSGFTHEQGHFQGVDFRRYRLTPEHAEIPLDLIIAQQDGFLTLTLNTELISDDLFAMALGLSKPQNTLADSGRLDTIEQQHGYLLQGLGFINHVAIIDGITGKEGSLLAKQINTLSEKNNSEYFQVLHNKTCQDEFTSIANNWPSTVFGYTQLDFSEQESTIAFSYAFESKNKVILSALQTLRGFIPNYAQDFENSIASTSLGLDVSHLSSALTTIWNDLQSPVYQCEPLATAQASLKEAGQSIGMLGLATNMASGVKGISAGVFGYQLSEDLDGKPALESLDSVVALHVENPETFFNSIKLFSPELQQVQLTSGGEAVSLNEIIPIDPALNLDLKAIIRGDHLIIYNGEKGAQQAEKLGLEKLSANGLYQVSFDMKPALTPFADLIEASGEAVPEELLKLLDNDIKTKINIDINDQAIQFDTVIKTNLIAPVK